LTFVVRTQDQPRRTGTVTALHRADMRVTAALERETEFRREKVVRVMGIEPTRPARYRAPDQLLTDDGGLAFD